MPEKIDAVQRMQDYIKEHFAEEITLSDLAKVSLYSPWYSYRIFLQETEMTPFAYIRRLRLSNSAKNIRRGKQKIADAAFESGFKSVDGFQRAFLKEFGCNPGTYASRSDKNPMPIYLFTPYGVKFRNVERRKKMEKTKNIFVQSIKKPERKVIIKRGIEASDYFEYCGEVGCDVWGLLLSLCPENSEPVCLWLPEEYRKPDTSKYVQGVELPPDYEGEIPEGFDLIALPEAEYLMFQGEPFSEEDYCEAVEEVQTAMEKYDPSVIGCKWDDKNPRIQLEPVGERGYIELKAICRK